MRIGLQLPWLGFDSAVLPAEPLWVLFWVGLLLILVRRLMQQRVRSCWVKLLLVDLFLPQFVVLLDQPLGLLDELIIFASGGKAVERSEEGLVELAGTRGRGLEVSRRGLRFSLLIARIWISVILRMRVL